MLFYDINGAASSDFVVDGPAIYAIATPSTGAAALTVSASTIAGLETEVATAAAYKIDDADVSLTIVS